MTDVVVTGVGAVTPLGIGAPALFERWAAGEVGIEDGEGRCREFDADRPPLGQGRAPRGPLHAVRARRLDRGARRRRLGRRTALRRRRGRLDHRDGHRRAGHDRGQRPPRSSSTGPSSVSPLAVPLMMGNAAAAAVSMRHGLRGPGFGTMSACSSGADAIGTAMRAIARGDAVAIVAGGAEAALTPLSHRGLRRAGRALGDRHLAALRRPPRRLRDGRGRGRARARERRRRAGARRAVLAVLRGYGATADAHHVTAPDPAGSGARRGDRARPSRDAGFDPGRRRLRQRAWHLDAAQRPRRDARAQGGVFGARAATRPVSSTKSAIGHLLGAAGRGRGGRDDPRAARAADPTDARPRGSPTPSSTSTSCPERPAARARRRAAGDRDLQLVRLRRPQHRAVSGGNMTLALVPRPDERLTPLERLEVLCDPGLARPAAHRGALAAHGGEGAAGRRGARRQRARRRPRGRASSRRTPRSRAARSARPTPRRSSPCSSSRSARACR